MKSQDILILAGIGLGAYLIFNNERQGISDTFGGMINAPGQMVESLLRESNTLVQGGLTETFRTFETITEPTFVYETTKKGVETATDVGVNLIAGAGSGWFESWKGVGEQFNKDFLRGEGLIGVGTNIVTAPWEAGVLVGTEINKQFLGGQGLINVTGQAYEGAVNQAMQTFAGASNYVGTALGIAPPVATTQESTAPLQTESVSETQAQNRISSGGFNSGSGGGVVGGQTISDEQSYTGSGQAWTPRQIASGYSTSPGAIAGTG